MVYVGEKVKKYYRFNLNVKKLNPLTLIGLIPIMIFLSLRNVNLNMNGFVFVEMILYFFVHEIFHGIAFSLFVKNKSNVKFGALLEKGVFYTMCQERINKKQIIISLLFPLIFLTIIAFPIGLIIHSDNLCLLALFNLIGASGDVLMALLAHKMPDDIEYIDYDNSVGCTFISRHDLSKYKVFALDYMNSGNDSDKLIDKSIKRIYISKKSYIVLAFYLLVAIFIIVLDYI